MASKLLADTALEAPAARRLGGVCRRMHQNAIELSAEYLRIDSRINYVTPSSYLELMQNVR